MPEYPDKTPITELLRQWSQGDRRALDNRSAVNANADETTPGVTAATLRSDPEILRCCTGAMGGWPQSEKHPKSPTRRREIIFIGFFVYLDLKPHTRALRWSPSSIMANKRSSCHTAYGKKALAPVQVHPRTLRSATPLCHSYTSILQR
jgi:hypothetical protein